MAISNAVAVRGFSGCGSGTRRLSGLTLAIALLAAACTPAAAPASTSAPTLTGPAPTAASAPNPPAPVTAPATAGVRPSVAGSPGAPGAPPLAAPSPAVGLGAVRSQPATGTAPSFAAVQPLAQRATLRLLLNPNMVNLPLFIALDQDAFSKAGLDMQITRIPGSTSAQLPAVAHGDLDVAPMTPGPALFNQLSQGFDIKVPASMGAERAGRATVAWLMALPDEADQLQSFQDLRGKTVEAGSSGSPMDVMVQLGLSLAGLTPGKDVNVTYRRPSAVDMLTLAQNRAADVMGMPEPVATQAAKQGFVKRWKALSDVAPWYQPSLLVVSNQYLTTNRAALEKFLEVYLVACRLIDGSDGLWTPDLIRVATQNLSMQPSDISDQGGVPYFSPNGTVSLESLARIQDLWVHEGAVQQTVDASQMVDTGPLQDAIQNLGPAPE